ncbi:MAG TPA: transglutaminase domain-containing protein [Saprospiraceae bacterium]|nr:transglutaminase domain-containing protein [Saprospiraceae bacterium]
MTILRILMFYLFLSAGNFSANGNNEPDFQHVDRFARQLKKSSTLDQTARQLTIQFETEVEKVRAIFVWITYNIGYDIHKVKDQQRRNNRTVITANSQAELDAYIKKMPRKMADNAFSSGKGVCEDYSNLFLFMCQSIGIEASYITGYGRSSADKLNKYPDRSNHVWNGVKINDTWYLLDATWSAGQVDMRTGKFTRDFTDGFFLADPVKFILTHFPDDPEWQLVGSPLDLDKFVTLPLGYPSLHDPEILDYYPKKGVISRENEIVKLVLQTEIPADQFELYINNRYHSTATEADENRVVFQLDVSRLKNAEITITRIGDVKVIPLISYLVD